MEKIKAWSDKLRGYSMLDVGRTTVVIAASLSVLLVVGGLLVAFVYEMGTWSKPSKLPVPRLYNEKPIVIDVNVLDARLAPPTNVRFVNTIGPISSALKKNQILGYFTAQSANKLAAPPKDFLIIGGADSEYFERRIDTRNNRSVLVPSSALLNFIENQLAPETGSKTHNFFLTLLAYDEAGNRSEPTSVPIPLVMGKLAVAPKEGTDTPGVQATQSALDTLASEIAFSVHPERPPKADFMTVFKIARGVPKRCNVASNDAQFLENYRRAFDHLKGRLTAANVESVFMGLCDAWSTAVAEERSALTLSKRNREEMMQYNYQVLAEDQRHDVGLRSSRNFWLLIVLSTIGVFFLLVLLLALLSIERHTRALHSHINALDNGEFQSSPAKE